MTVVDSRVRKGYLRLGAAGPDQLDVSCQPTNVRLEPSANTEGDPLEVLCGDTISPVQTTTWTLAGTAVQDWENADGLVMWAMQNANTVQPFEWQPTWGGKVFRGEVTVAPLAIGGDVGARNTSDFEWALQGDPVPDEPPAPTLTAVSPATGPAAGGTVVTLTGTGVAPGMTVDFDTADATAVTVSSPTTARATTPAHAAGAVDVMVGVAGQTAVLEDGFTYA